MSDRSDYVAIIARKMYQAASHDVAVFVEAYAWQSRTFKVYYLTMTDRSLRLFETSVLKRLKRLEENTGFPSKPC